MPIKSIEATQPAMTLPEPVVMQLPTSISKASASIEASPLGGSFDPGVVAGFRTDVRAVGAALPGGILASISTGEPAGKTDGGLGALDAIAGRNEAGSVADPLAGGQKASPLDEFLAKTAPPERSLKGVGFDDLFGFGNSGGSKGNSDGTSREDLFGFGKSGDIKDPGPPQGDRGSNPLDGMFNQETAPSSDGGIDWGGALRGSTIGGLIAGPAGSLVGALLGGQSDSQANEKPAYQSVGTAPGAVDWSDSDGMRYTGTGEIQKQYGDTILGTVGKAIGTGLPSTPTGQQLKQTMDELDRLGGSTDQPTPSEPTKAQEGQSDTPAAKPSASQPIEGEEFAIDSNVMAWLQRDVDAMKQHSGGQNGGDTDPATSDGTAYTGGTGAVTDAKERLLGGDTADPDATRPSGGDTTNPQQGGDIDFGPDQAGTPQTSGAEERQSSGGPLERPARETGNADGGQSHSAGAFDEFLAGLRQPGLVDPFSSIADSLPAQPLMPSGFELF